ncbi:MAG: tetratricopeptide repeat protein [Planctomycetia bacterium]|nr:tetratricopeptide repeat protein [Planctomycetia bacterium]
MAHFGRLRLGLRNRAAVVAWTMALGLAILAGPVWAQQDAGDQAYAAAAALHNRELYDLAADEWQKFVAKYPNHKFAGHGHQYLGICYYKQKQFAKAQAEFETVLKSFSKFPELETTYYFLGRSQLSLAQEAKQNQAELFSKAAATFTALLEKHGKGKYAAQALYYRGDSRYYGGKKEEAIADYAAVVKTYPNDSLAVDALYNQGVSEEELGKADAAMATFGTFLSKHGKHALATEVSMRYGEALFTKQQYAEAEKYFAAAAGAKEFALADHAAIRQAACLAARKKHGEAAALFASIPDRFPKSTNVALAWLEAGRSHFLAGNIDEARKALQNVGAEPGDVGLEATHLLAQCLLKQKKPAEALSLVSAALPKAQNSRLAPQLLMDQADATFDIADRRKESVALYAAVAAKHAQDPLAPQAAYMAAFAALDVGDFAAAQAHADSFLKTYANSSYAADVLHVAAECQLQLRQYDKAAESFRQLVAKYSQHAEADKWKVRAGLALYLQKKYPETIEALKTHARSLKSPELVAEAQFLVGSSHNELKEFDKGAAALEASLKASDTWRKADEAALALAIAYRQTGQAKAAADELRRLVKSYDKSPLRENAHYLLAEWAYEGRDFPAAKDHYQKVMSGFSGGKLAPHAQLGLAWTHLGLGDAAVAEKNLSALVDTPAGKALGDKTRYPRGLARHRLKQYGPAADDLLAFLKTDPPAAERSDARYVLGLCQVGQKQWPQAAETFRALLADDPSYAGADKVRFELGWALKEQKQSKEAAAVFAELVQKHPQSAHAPQSLFHVAEAAYEAGNFREAARQYYDAEQKAADMLKAGKLAETESKQVGENATHKLGWCYYMQNDFGNAEKSFDYQIRTYGGGALEEDARFMLGESLFKQNKHAEAVKAYDALQKPTSEDFLALASLHAAQAQNQLKQYDDGLKRAKEFEQKFAKSEYLPEALFEQGWALQNVNKLDEALKVYESVTAKTNREVAAKARFMIGEIYFAKKDHKEAVRNYFKVAYGYGYATWQANAHYEAARCFEVLGNLDQAKKSYQEVVEKHPESDKAPLAKKKLETLGG